MKKYIRSATFEDLPDGDHGQPVLHASSAKEIDNILFSEGGMTQYNVMDAIRNKHTSSSTLAKLVPYATWFPSSASRFAEYVSNPKVPKQVVKKLIEQEFPKMKKYVDTSDEYWNVYYELESAAKCCESVGVSPQICKELHYYADNCKDIILANKRNAAAARRSSVKGDLTQLADASIKSFLQANNIDTTSAKYELCAEAYERYESGRKYRKSFTCNGDWLAYLSMCLHGKPTAQRIEEYFDVDGFIELVANYPTAQDIADHASNSWWGDGDDYIIYLKNLTTGEYLYQGEEEELVEDED